MLRLIDGFSHYSIAQFLKKWTVSVAADLTIEATAGRFGGPSLRVSNTGADYGFVKTFDNQATWIFGYAIKINTSPDNNTPLMSFSDSGVVQTVIALGLGNTIRAYRQTGNYGSAVGTLLGTADRSLLTGIWHYLETKVTIHNSTGSIEIKLDGITILNLTGIDNAQTTNNFANQVSFGPRPIAGGAGVSSTFGVYLADLYICDGQGSVNNNFLGDIRVDTLLPNADGANLDWTPSTGTDHYALVDENPSTEDTDYISTSVAGNRDTFAFTNLASTPATIFGVQIGNFVKKMDAGNKTITPVVRAGGVNYDGVAAPVLTDYFYSLEVMETNPATTSAWTESDVNGAEFGIKLAS